MAALMQLMQTAKEPKGRSKKPSGEGRHLSSFARLGLPEHDGLCPHAHLPCLWACR